MHDAGLVAAGAGGALLVVAVALLVQRRSLKRRIAAATVRLDPGRSRLEEGGRLERQLARFERAVDSAVERSTESAVGVERLARALGAIPQGIVICDDHGREVFRNEAAQAFVGARHAEALVDQATRDLLDEALAGHPQRRNLDLFGPPRRMLVISAVALDDGHRTTGALAVVDDVSERRRLEAVRRDFVANISHELKTPVGALGLLAETLAAEDDGDVARRLAERMQSEAMRVGRIIDDLLDLTRIEAEETPLREPVPVHLLIAEAIERVRPLAEQKGIVVTGDEPTRRQTVRGDRRQLVSALFNLLENAVKYSDEGSTVEVRSRTDGRWVELAVRDHGIGIPTRDLERVFERFYRVDRARSRETGGTGLGLAIVRHVASNHRGEVRVDSQEGEGSIFTLRLPSGPGPVVVSTAEAG